MCTTRPRHIRCLQTLVIIFLLIQPSVQLSEVMCGLLRNLYVNLDCSSQEKPYCTRIINRMTSQIRGKPACKYRACSSKNFEACLRGKSCVDGTVVVEAAMCSGGQVCCHHPPNTCEDLHVPALNNRVFPHNLGFDVVCDTVSDGGGWTVIQRRFDGSQTFDRVWRDYSEGFGRPDGEFWLGFHNILLLLARGPHEVRFEIQLANGDRKFIQYTDFSIGTESEKYKLSVKRRNRKEGGTADGSSIEAHDGMAFSTRDVDNDLCRCSCASSGRGGWWYRRCLAANLNGEWGNRFLSRGPLWVTETGLSRPLIATRIMIRLRGDADTDITE